MDVLNACTTWEKLKFTDLLDLNVEQIRKVINSTSPIEQLEEIKTQISADLSKLVTAAAKGDLDLVKELGEKLSKEAMDKPNEKGWSALTAATYYGQEEVVKELVEHFHVDRNQADTNGKTASTIAELPCAENVLGIAGEIVKKAKPLH